MIESFKAITERATVDTLISEGWTLVSFDDETGLANLERESGFAWQRGEK